MNDADLRKIVSIVPYLPEEDGVIIERDRDTSNGDYVRTITVEWPKQTVRIDIMFADTNERERAFAELLAHGAGLLSRLSQGYMVESSKREDTLEAFRLVFNVLVDDNADLKHKLFELSADDETQVTGENND